MKRRPIELAFVLFCLGLACDHSADAPALVPSIEQFGLEESPRDHALMSSAMKAASDVLPRTATLAFRRGWDQPITAAVPVFAATTTGLSKGEIMVTHAECRCVIVQAGSLSAWLAAHQGAGDALLSMDVPSLLGYMLLHEAGHIKRGKAFDIPSAEASGDHEQAGGEIEADDFAADAINAALLEKGTSRGLTAAKIAVTLSQLSWNFSAHRLLDDFGGTALRKPELFQDAGLSHPNLEWRVLRVNALISKTPTAQKLLDDFENARRGEPVFRLFP